MVDICLSKKVKPCHWVRKIEEMKEDAVVCIVLVKKGASGAPKGLEPPILAIETGYG